MFLNQTGNFTILIFSLNRYFNLITFFFLSPVSPFFFAFTIPPILIPYLRQGSQAKNDKIRIISAFSDVDYEEQEDMYEEIEGKISQDILENDNINLKETEVKESQNLSNTDKYYSQPKQPKYNSWKKIPSQSQQTEFSTVLNFDHKFETSVFSGYPQKYDTVDRRRKEKLLSSHFEDSERMQYDDKSNSKSAYPDAENYNCCHIEKKKQNFPVLHPYKNGFVVKSGTWTTKLGSYDDDLPCCLRDCEKSSGSNQHLINLTPLDIIEDSTSSTSEELLGSPVSDEQEDLLSPTWNPSNIHHIGDFPDKYYVANTALQLESINCDANAVGRSMGEIIPSTEESKEDYVDTMDELQCLVETVSEYLAEKEEEINRFGSLSKTKTDKQNSTIDDTKQKMHEDQIPPLTVTKNDKDKALSFPELNGVKCAVGSLFSSLTEKVGSGTKHLTNSVEKLVYIVPEKKETLNQTETINLESRPSASSVLEKDLSMQSSLSSQTVDDKDISRHGRTSGNEHMGNKMRNLSFENAIKTTERDSVPQSSVIKSVFSMLNPLKVFSEKEETKKDDQSKELKRESFVGCGSESNQREDTLDNHSGSIIALNRREGETRDWFQMPASEDLLSPQVASEPSNSASCASKKEESLLEGKNCVDLSLLPDHPKICAKDMPGHLSVSGSTTANKEASSKPLEKDKVTGDDDFLEPLRKSFSQFLFASPDTCSKETLSESMKIDQVEEDGWERGPKKDGHSFSFSEKLHIPFFRVLSHSEKQQDLKEKGSIFPLFKFPFTDSHKVVNDQSVHDSAVTTDKDIQRSHQEEAKLSSVKSNSLPNVHNDLEKFDSTKEFNKNDQVNCSEDIKLSSIRSSSVPNIYNDLGKFGSTEEFSKNEQIHCPEDAKLNTINADSASNINNNFGKFGSIEELHPSGHMTVENYERDALPIPEVVPPKHKTSDLLREGKNFTQVTFSTVSDSSLEFSSTISKSTVINEDNVIDNTSKKQTQGGLLSGLFNRFSSENLSSQQELNSKNNDSPHKNSTPSLLLSGIFNLMSNSSMSDCKPDEGKFMSLGDIKSLDENKHLSLDESPATSCVQSENKINQLEKHETSGFTKSFLALSKENIPSSDAWVNNHYCPPTCKTQQNEKHCPISENIVFHSVAHSEQGLLEKSLTERPTSNHILEAKSHEKLNTLNSPILNANIFNKSNHYQTFEGMNNPFCFEWDSDIKDLSKNSRKRQPVYYMLNQNTFPSADVFLWPDSQNPVINFCQKDQNSKSLEWRTNLNSVIWCDLPYESSNQLAFNEDYLLRGDVWAANSLYGNSVHLPINETKNSLEDLPIDLSYSSDYEKTTCSIVDQESLRIDGNFIFSGFGYEYQEWLSCLENGVWWPSENGDYGYYMFHDGQYIYSLLTDSTGQYVYLFIPDYSYQEYLNYDLQTNYLSSIMLDDSIISAQSLKVLDKEDEILWYVEEEPIDDPLDLSVTLPRSKGPLCLNLENFSQALEESSSVQQDQPLDFSVCNLQKFKGDFMSSKERPCGSEDLEYTLDLRNQPQTISNHVLNRGQVTVRDENQPLAKDSSVHLSSFQWLPSFSEETSSSVHPENMTKGLQQAEETPSVNKVTPLFSVWGALVGSTLNFDKSESLEALVMQKMDQQSKLTELTNDDLQSLISSKQLKSNSQKEEENQLKYSEKQTVSNVQQPEFTKNIRQGFPLNKSIPVKKQSLLKSGYQVSQTTSQAKSSKEGGKIITADSVSDPPVPQFSRDEHKRCDLPQEQSSKEPEKALFKNALKLFGREESSLSTMANEKQASRFLNLFKTQANKEESSNLEKNDGNKNGKTSSQEKKESSSVSNFFGTLGEFFKTNVSPIQTPENMPLSSVNDKDEVRSSLNSVQLTSQSIGNLETPATVSGKGKIRGRSLNKQATIDDSRLRESSIREIQDSNLNEKEKPFRDHLIQQSTDPSFSTSCLKDSPRDSSKETSDMSPVTEVPRSSKIPFDIQSRRNSNEQDHLPGKDWSFSTATTSASQPEPPIKKSLFSFLNRSEKSENRTSTALPRARSQAEGLFTLPSFFSTTNSSIKDTSHKSSSFSFFSLSFLDEKQQTPVAPVTTQPCKKPSVFVDTIVTMTREGSSDHRDSIAQELVHEQQMAPCISTSNTTEVTSLADELSVEETEGKLSSSNEPETSSDFQMNQVQKDTVPLPSELQAHAETFVIDPETLEVTPHKEESLNQKAFPSGSLAKSFSYENHLNEKLNDLDASTERQNETFTSDPLNLPLEMVSDEVSPQILESATTSPDPGFAGHLQNQDADKKEDKSRLDSKVEVLSGFVTKVKSFSGCLIEPPKTFSGLFSSPKSPKKNSFLSFSSNASSQPLKGELFGIFRSSKPETYKQESSVATSGPQNGCSRDAVGSIPPESLHTAASAGLSSDSTLSDCRMTVVSTKSEVVDDPKLTIKVEKNNIPENVPEPEGFETVAMSSVSEDDTGQGVLSLSDEGDMGMLQGTDTEASLEAEHILLPMQLPPDPAWIAEELPPPIQPPLLEPEPAPQTASTNQDFLELQATNSLETNTTLFDEANVNESTTLETQGDLYHPLQEEPVLCAKEICGIPNAQEDPTAIPQEMEQPRPRFEIPNMTNWPKLRFPSSTTDCGKSLSSLFSPPSPSGNRAVETGLMSGFKKLSTLFEGGNERSVPASNPKLGFGKKLDLSFSWPKENKGGSEHIPGESSPTVLVISSDQDLNSSEASKALESSQISGASAQPAEVFTQPSGTSEQLDARPGVSVHGLSGSEEVKTQPEISAPGPGEHGDAKDNLFGSTCPLGKPKEEHCTVFEVLHQPEKQEEEVLPASTDCVSNVQRPSTPDDNKEPMTNKRPVLNSSIINGFKELTIYDAGDLVIDC